MSRIAAMRLTAHTCRLQGCTMGSQDQLNPDAARLAVIGMRSAYERNFTLCLTESHDLEGIGTSAVDVCT
jgi:hypothetical protein